jgi:pullulanase/glycogen debranching enzyme
MRRGQRCPPVRVCTTFAKRTRLSSSVARALGGQRGIAGLSLNELLRRARIEVHGIRLNEPDPSPESHGLAVTLRDIERADLLHAMFNAYWEPLVFELPPLDPRRP